MPPEHNTLELNATTEPRVCALLRSLHEVLTPSADTDLLAEWGDSIPEFSYESDALTTQPQGGLGEQSWSSDYSFYSDGLQFWLSHFETRL